MKLIELYIFRRMGRAFLLALVTLSATVWLTQALRQFDLVSDMGQTVVTFFEVTLLLLPALTTIVSPVAILIAVIYTFRSLNSGSELVIINASGARQGTLLKPVLIVGLCGTLFMAAMTLYFSPLSLRVWRALLTNVRSNVISSILKEGEFMNIAPGLTFRLRHRRSDGTMEGIFIADDRATDVAVNYLAERGAVLDNPLGVFLVMNNGTIQRRNKVDNSISIIEFSSYAFDLSALASRASVPAYKPSEQTTQYLLNPDPGDRYYQQYPGKFRSELLYRLTAPLNALLFAILPLVFLSQAETTRQQRSATTTIAIGCVVIVGTVEFLLNGASETSMAAVLVSGALPLAAIAISIVLVLTGKQPRPPERLIALGDAISARVRNLFRGAEAAPVTGRSG